MIVTGSRFEAFARENKEVWREILGARVEHKTFGWGSVKTLDEELRVLVHFDTSVQSKVRGLTNEVWFNRSVFSGGFITAVELPETLNHGFKVDTDANAGLGSAVQVPQSATPAPATAHLATTGYFRPAADQERIRQLCIDREITALVHFTRIENLSSILSHGLLSRRELENRPDISPIINDTERLDGCRGAVSLSIGFPNYRMFFKYRNHTATSWVILQLHPRLLWDLDCAFCPGNAAGIAIKTIPISQRRDVEMLEAMFGERPEKRREELSIPLHFTTDPQAEVLVFGEIDPTYILAVDFRSEAERAAWQKQNGSRASAPLCVEKDWFSPRCDYMHWQTNSPMLSDVKPPTFSDGDIPF